MLAKGAGSDKEETEVYQMGREKKMCDKTPSWGSVTRERPTGGN